MSIDHKPSNPDEEKRIKEAGGHVFWDRISGMLNVSRALGDLTYKNKTNLDAEDQQVTCVPGVKTEIIDEDTEFLIVACDGVWDCMTNEEVIEYIHQYKAESEGNFEDLKASEILSKLFDYNLPKDQCGLERKNAKPGAGTDNMSAILLFFKK
jgi:protein phosphatase PTC2/3